MNTTYFNRPATHHMNQTQRINDAYTLAGLTAPTHALEIRNKINSAPTPDQVAASIAREALDADNINEFYDEAIDRMAKAHAAQALKDAFSRNIQSALEARAHKLRGQAVEDVSPAFNKIAKAISTAAKALPTGAPLDMSANIEAGTGAEFKTVRDGLAKLGAYAAIYPQGTPADGVPAALHAVLPIVSLPSTTIERIKQSIGENIVTSNEAQLAPTRTVRKLSNDLAKDPDNTLALIAAGHYEGVTIALATPEQLGERRKHAVNAFKRITDKHDTTNSMIAV